MEAIRWRGQAVLIWPLRSRPNYPDRLLRRDFSPEVKRIWIETIDAVSADWLSTFAGCETMLGIYCEMTALNQRLAVMVSLMSGGDHRWPGLVKLFHIDCAILLRMATMLRLMPPSSRPDQGYEVAVRRGLWVN
jgi:hypothetical protein